MTQPRKTRPTINEPSRRSTQACYSGIRVRDHDAKFSAGFDETEWDGVAVRRGADRFTVVGDGLVGAGLMEDKITRSALLLVLYGRISQWRPIAKGQLLTWGRRPWRALRFKRLFHNP